MEPLTVPTALPLDAGSAPRSDATNSSATWQQDLARAIRCPKELLRQLQLLPQHVPDADMKPDSRFPLLVPISFVERMRPGDAADPLLRQVLPRAAERTTVPGFLTDAVDDGAARKAPGLLQKYSGRALLIAAGSCSVHCRYCFRRNYPYSSEPRRIQDWEPALAELRNDTSVTEVILSGGDPLMLTDRRLTELCERLSDVRHIERLRIHSRLPIVLPSRVTNELLELLSQIRPQVIMVVHANHANEVTGDCSDALQRLLRQGLPVLNQAVLLKDINDSVEALEALSRALVNLGVMPYYLHQLDRVSGTAHFEASVGRGSRLIRELRERLPGYAVPQFVQEVPGQRSKIPIH